MEEEAKYCVYMHKNKINSKVYIGQTKNYKKRCTPGNYDSQYRFGKAIQKYGWDNFDHYILKESLTQEEANYWEKYYIKYYQSTNSEFGYNMAEGGAYSVILSGENNPFFGHKHTEEALEIMKEKKYGGNNPNAKEVVCLNTGEVFPSCREASEWCNIPRQNINRCAKGGRPTAGKHPSTGEKLRWRYKEDENRSH